MAAPQQQGSQADNSLAAFWIAIFFFMLAGVIWYLFHAQIVWFILQVKIAEASLIGLFTTKLTPFVINMKTLPSAGLSLEELGGYVRLVGLYIRYPFCIILLILAAVLFFGHPILRYKRTHNMKSLLEQERFNWPQIMPVSKVDLVKEHVDKGPWSMALTPMQFAKKHKLLYEERTEGSGLNQKNKVTVGLLRTEAYQVFALQLGNYWSGVERLNIHTKALFAVFAARANRDQDGAKALLDTIATSTITGHLDFTGTDELLKKYKDKSNVARITQKHAFVMTVMASMLTLAREDGVLASADFLWLKTLDRPLWYILNSVGRQTPPTEISGVFAHWLAELKMGRPIRSPMVDEAVKALDIGLKEVIYIPDEEQD